MAFLRYHVIATEFVTGDCPINGFFFSSEIPSILFKLEEKYKDRFDIRVTPIYLTHLPKYCRELDKVSQEEKKVLFKQN